MAYEKRVCVLKQMKRGFSADGGTLSGAIYAERLGTELTITPRIAGLAPLKEGRYALAVWAGGKIFCCELNGALKIPDAPALAQGFAALLCFVRAEAEPIAYGRCGEAPFDCAELLDAFSESSLQTRKKREPEQPEKLVVPACDIGEEANARPFREEYHDEAIALDNYYGVSESGEDARADIRVQEEDGAHAGAGDSREDDGALPPRPVGRTLAYYYEVKDKLDDALKKFPRDERLQAIFPHSEWASSNGALLGIIYEEGIPRYLCVAAESTGEVSEEMKTHGVFVPENYLSDEKGFYVVFQDADTGEYVRVQDA